MQDNTAYKALTDADKEHFGKFATLEEAIKECDRLGESKCGTINYDNSCCGKKRRYALKPELKAVHNSWNGYRVYTRSDNYDSC